MRVMERELATREEWERETGDSRRDGQRDKRLERSGRSGTVERTTPGRTKPGGDIRESEERLDSASPR